MGKWLLESDDVPASKLQLFVAMRGGCVALERKPHGVVFVVIYHRRDPLCQLLLDTGVYYNIYEVCSTDLDRLLRAHRWRIQVFLANAGA